MKDQKLKKYSQFVLGGDVGGTNTTLGLFGFKDNKPELVFSIDLKTKKLKSLILPIQKMQLFARNNNIVISGGCLAVAGPVSADRDFCNPTYINWNIDTRDIRKKTNLDIFLINDFEGVGYGINLLQKKDIIEISKGRKAMPKATKAIIGAGTGLGKSILVYQNNPSAYIPIPSEGGFSDFPVRNEVELSLLNFIRKNKKIKAPISCEELISGKGIESIYLFLRKRFKPTKFTVEIEKSIDKVPLISRYRCKDRTCEETFRLYTRFYARIAKNFVLDSLARGGLYITGGIATKNEEIFNTDDFMDEFEDVHRQHGILKRVPVWLITNHRTGLYGSAYAAMKERGGLTLK